MLEPLGLHADPITHTQEHTRTRTNLSQGFQTTREPPSLHLHLHLHQPDFIPQKVPRVHWGHLLNASLHEANEVLSVLKKQTPESSWE